MPVRRGIEGKASRLQEGCHATCASSTLHTHIRQALRAHHGDIGKADGQNERRSVGGGSHGAKGGDLGGLLGQRS